MLKILTLNWNGKDKLQTLYPTLMNVIGNIDYQWLIKDNGSNDDSILLEKEWNNNKVHIINYPHNRDNFAHGCNFLFKEANPTSEDLVLLLNNDVIFNDTSSLKNMISIIENDNSVGVVGARLLYKNTNKLQHAGVTFTPGYKTPMHFRSGEISDVNAEKNREFQAVTGAVFLTKAKYYENICRTNKSGLPGMDQNLWWSFDDICSALAIKYQMNKKIVYCGHTNIFHEESATLKKNPVNKMFLTQNLKYFFSQWSNKYTIDRDSYINNPNHNIYKL